MPLSQDHDSPVHDTLYVHLELDSQASASQDGDPQTGENLYESAFEPEQEELVMAQTHVQGDIGSLVEDTQFISLEKDTQAPPDLPEASQAKSQETHMPSQGHDPILALEAAVPHSSGALPVKSQVANILSQDYDLGLASETLPQSSETLLAQSQRPTHMTAEVQDEIPITPTAFFSRPSIVDPSPEFKFGPPPVMMTANSMTRFPAKTTSHPQFITQPGPEMPASGILNTEPSGQPAIESHNASASSNVTTPVQDMAISQIEPVLEAASSFRHATQPHNTSVPPHKAPPVQTRPVSLNPAVPSRDETSIQAIDSIAKDSVESGTIPISINTVSAGSSTQSGFRPTRLSKFSDFIPDDISASDSSAVPNVIDHAPILTSVPESLPQEVFSTDMLNAAKYPFIDSRGGYVTNEPLYLTNNFRLWQRQ